MHCTVRVPSAAHSMLSAGYNLLAHSKNELMRWRGVCRLCVCVSVNFFCGNRYYDAKNGSIATKLAQDGHHVGAHPRCAQGRGQGQRSRDTGTFVLDLKSLFLAGKWLDCNQTCTR